MGSRQRPKSTHLVLIHWFFRSMSQFQTQEKRPGFPRAFDRCVSGSVLPGPKVGTEDSEPRLFGNADGLDQDWVGWNIGMRKLRGGFDMLDLMNDVHSRGHFSEDRIARLHIAFVVQRVILGDVD